MTCVAAGYSVGPPPVVDALVFSADRLARPAGGVFTGVNPLAVVTRVLTSVVPRTPATEAI